MPRTLSIKIFFLFKRGRIVLFLQEKGIANTRNQTIINHSLLPESVYPRCPCGHPLIDGPLLNDSLDAEYAEQMNDYVTLYAQVQNWKNGQGPQPSDKDGNPLDSTPPYIKRSIEHANNIRGENRERDGEKKERKRCIEIAKRVKRRDDFLHDVIVQCRDESTPARHKKLMEALSDDED